MTNGFGKAKARLASNYVVNDKGCWEWQGAVSSAGYGAIKVLQKTWSVHRLSALFAFGDLGGAMVLHHCDNRICYNPAHLYLGTVQDNARDTWSRRRHPYCHQSPECPNGHLYDDANTYITKKGYRKCRTCRREGMRRATTNRSQLL